MNKVIVETYTTRPDMIRWCYTQFGDYCAGELIREDYEWAFRTEMSQIIFTFKNPADATMFRLRWL